MNLTAIRPSANQTLSSSNFYERVFEVVKQIPSGRVTSYGAIANYLGSSRAARMVGWALNSTKDAPGWIPAHRVVNRNGLLSGRIHFMGERLMKELLESEGVKVVDNRVDDFQSVFWDPSEITN